MKETVSKTVIDISYDSAKITHNRDSREVSERDICLDTGWNQNTLKLLYWEAEKLAPAAAVNSYIFPISSVVKSKAMNT